MIAAARLFIIMGLFGLVAGSTYLWWNWGHPEMAGVGLLMTFFLACVFIGSMLWSISPANKRRGAAPDTGLPGSAHPTRGARDEHGNMHVIPPTIAPAVYTLAAAVILGAVLYRDQLKGLGMGGGLALGLLLFVAATIIWYRATSADARAKVHGHGHGEHPSAAAAAVAEPAGPPGPANYFEQVREALEVGDADWASAAYAPDAVYYEPANPPHEGREDIRAYLNDLLKGHRNLQFTVERMGVDGDSAIVEWTWSFRTLDNRRVSGQAGASVIQVGPGGITYHRDYL
ncbi:MAG TPA: nuclear transport factor 2 family protein [Actinomycetes bacterium]|nr:nuclear transport factor 2 family protein [Actinomycetes bacterium]